MLRMQGVALTVIAALLANCACAKELSELEALNSRPTHCVYERAYEWYGAYCVGLKLTKLPSLKGGIEILDLTDNKLKELPADFFSSHTGMKFLYLSDNSIFSIHENTFSSLTYLDTLDLSMNVIQNLPLSIFNLPSLRNLFISGNPLVTLDVDIKTVPKPIKAPLENLDLSNCRLFHLPDFGILPQLRFYNVSRNPLKSLETKLFASTCNLIKVDLTDSIQYMKLCDLRPAVMWLKQKRAYIILDDYAELNSEEFEKCPSKEITAGLNITHHNCKSEYLQVQSVKASRNKWLSIGGGLAGFLVAFILLLYVMHRHNVAQTKKTTKKNNPLKGSEKQTNATASLLNIS